MDEEELIDVEEGDLVMYVEISTFDVIRQEYTYSWQNLIKRNKKWTSRLMHYYTENIKKKKNDNDDAEEYEDEDDHDNDDDDDGIAVQKEWEGKLSYGGRRWD